MKGAAECQEEKGGMTQPPKKKEQPMSEKLFNAQIFKTVKWYHHIILWLVPMLHIYTDEARIDFKRFKGKVYVFSLKVYGATNEKGE